MQNQGLSERELAEKIVQLHDEMGLGFRKVARKFGSEGVEISKDKAHRLYRKYRAPSKTNLEQEIMDEELKLLVEEEEETEKKIKLEQLKDEKRRRIALLLVQEAEASFKVRKGLFEHKAKLLCFSEKVLPVVNPALWLRLTNFCSQEKIDLVDAIQKAIGSQADYEEIRADYKKTGIDRFLDEHLCLYLRDSLERQQDEQVEEDNVDEESDERDVTVTTEADKDEEFVDIWI